MKLTTETTDDMDDVKTGVRHAQRYEANPFLEALVVQTRGRRVTVAAGSTLIDMQTGEISGVTEIAQVVEVDKQEFVKLFTRDLAIWFDLKRSGLRCFGALLTIVQQEAVGRDLVYFDYASNLIRSFGLSKPIFYRGVEELIEKKFIARHRSVGWYFINPALFFNGNRARFVKEYRNMGDIEKIDKLIKKGSENE